MRRAILARCHAPRRLGDASKRTQSVRETVPTLRVHSFPRSAWECRHRRSASSASIRSHAPRENADIDASRRLGDAPKKTQSVGTRVLGLGLVAILLVSAPLKAQDIAAETLVTDPKSDIAIKKALDYLKTSQKPSGAWESGNFGEATSITSLAVMAYLSAGHVPGEPGPYRESIDRGIRYVVRHQKPNGLLVSNSSHGPMYCHGISTLMLAEVVGMSPTSTLSDEVRPVLSKAIELILKAQARKKPSDQEGGWRYQPDSVDSDLSVTGWQVMALRAAKSAGCNVPNEPIERAVKYIKRCSFKDGGGFGYQPGGGPTNPRTGTGTLALEICGEHLSAEAVAGAEYLLKHPPQWSSDYFFYEVYYAPQAMFQVGDKYFRGYYPKLVKVLLDHQEKDGSWYAGGGNDRSAGRVYCTATAVLALAVEYRYLPIYQR